MGSWYHGATVPPPLQVESKETTRKHCQSARYPAKNDKFFAGEYIDIPIDTKRLVRI
jgi:hypothetical protein